MRVSHDMERRAACACCSGTAVLDQCAANALAPGLRLDKERIQLRVTVVTRNNRREPRHHTRDFRHENTAALDLVKWYRDRVWILKQGFAVASVLERRAPLKRFKLPLLGH